MPTFKVRVNGNAGKTLKNFKVYYRQKIKLKIALITNLKNIRVLPKPQRILSGSVLLFSPDPSLIDFSEATKVSQKIT